MFILITAWIVGQHSLLKSIIPSPTGNNGYEEYLYAADLLKTQRFLDLEAQVSAAEKAWSLPGEHPEYLHVVGKETSEFERISRLISIGNQKTVQFPHTELNADTLFPEYAQLKGLARFETKSAYVDFSAGQVDAGLEKLLETMTFARKISAGILVSRLVGIGCDGIVEAELDRRFPQFTLEAALTLDAYVEEQLSAPPPGIYCMQYEEQMNLNTLRKFSGHLQQALVDETQSDPSIKIPTIPVDREEELIDFVSRELHQRTELVRTVLSAPESTWKEFLKPEPEGATVSTGARLFEVMGGNDTARTLVLAELKERVRLHLLQLNCKIIEYKWRNGQLPTSLAQCDGSKAAVDELCGGVYTYVVDGESYTLKSHGIEQSGEIVLRKPKVNNSISSDMEP